MLAEAISAEPSDALGWVQGLLEHHTDRSKLDDRQQTILAGTRGESPCRFRRAPL